MYPDDEIRISTVHKSLSRPQLLFGCDRVLIVLLLVATTLLIGPGGFAAGNAKNVVVGLLALLAGHRLLVALAKYDPDAREIFRRSMRFKSVYPAVSGAKAKGRVYTDRL